MVKLPDFKEEKKLWKKGYTFVIGVDEVGRGAFAGPVVASACAFAPQIHNSKFKIHNSTVKIDDSKKLKPREREKAAEWIKDNCLVYGIGEVGVRVINRVGIGKATEKAMRRAIKVLLKRSNLPGGSTSPGKFFVLVDGFHVRYLRSIGLKNQKAIKKGDQKSISIAAASILAKVYRDTLMQKLTKRYRKYHWGRNKGYGTKKHQEAILKNGSTTLHRKKFVETFLRKKSYATIS